jgi:hypothetical protein
VKTDQPIPFGDLSLLAHGGVIVEGNLRVITEGPLGPALQPPAGALLIANFTNWLRSTHGTLDLIPPSPVQPDGWRDWRAPILGLWFNGLVPDLARRRYGSGAQSFAVQIPDSPLLKLDLRYPADGSNLAPQIVAAVSSVEGTASPCPAGLRLTMTGPIDPTAATDRVPALTDARLECDVLLPWTYLAAVGSELAGLNFKSPEMVERGPWQPARSGPGALAVEGRRGYFAGHLKVPGQRLDLYPDGPFLQAFITDRVTELQGARDLRCMADGFARPSRFSSGPELMLQLGYDDFARILGQSRKAALKLGGGGIGHLYGQTGRDFGGLQPITACRITLSREVDGLEIELTGELGPLTDGPGTALGPAFEASMFVPLGYLLLRSSGRSINSFWIGVNDSISNSVSRKPSTCQFAVQKSQVAHVADGSISDLRRFRVNVRVTLDSGHDGDIAGGPGCADTIAKRF